MRKKGKIFILSGPSGSGKTTLYQKLLKRNKIKDRIVKTISVTTRLKREGEVHGKDYYFLNKKRFYQEKKAGHFLESQKVFDNYYATPKKAITDLLKKGQNVLLCIDVKGAKVVCRKFPRAVTIFIKTKTPEELKRRLQKRGSEDIQRLNLRLEIAREELKDAGRYQHIVINDTIPQALKDLEKIILSEIK